MTGTPLEARVGQLIDQFSDYLTVYDARVPFTRSGQLGDHAATLGRLRELGDPVTAVGNPQFVASLYATLKRWGIGVRGSHLRPLPDFGEQLRARAGLIGALSGYSISDPALMELGIDQRLWELIELLDIVENDAKLVALTKTLHHVLPDLVVPIDRKYTGRFFGWSPAAMQYQQRPLFIQAFATFNMIAGQVDLDSNLGDGWRTARAKLIDNAVVAYCMTEMNGEDERMSTRKRGGKYEPLRQLLASQGRSVELGFSEIDELIGGLPASARNHREWWANTKRNVQARAWLDAGKQVAMVNLTREVVRFTSI